MSKKPLRLNTETLRLLTSTDTFDVIATEKMHFIVGGGTKHPPFQIKPIPKDSNGGFCDKDTRPRVDFI